MPFNHLTSSARLSSVASFSGAPITRLRQECSSRPLLFHSIIKLLFLTLCFLLRRLSGVSNSLSCCLLTHKGSGRSSCLCEGAALNRVLETYVQGLKTLTSPFSNVNNPHLHYHSFFFSFFFNVTQRSGHTWKKGK